jgi:hypothetical protein
MSGFKKAQRKKVKIKLGITGPSGSGKTYSALEIATGLGGKIAVIDTENGSASLYSDRFEFDTLELRAPFTTEKYIEAINDAVKAGYDVLIIDSLSHAWNGEGGILDRKGAMDSRGGNSFTNWAKFTPEQEKFISALLHSDIHLIAAIRSKQDYVLTDNGKGKSAPQKVGLAPVQREGMEYELSVVFDVAMNHEAQTSKDRTGLFVDKIFKITQETGKQIKAWLDSGSDVKAELRNEIEQNLKGKPDDYVANVKKFISGKSVTEDQLQISLSKVKAYVAPVNPVNELKAASDSFTEKMTKQGAVK